MVCMLRSLIYQFAMENLGRKTVLKNAEKLFYCLLLVVLFAPSCKEEEQTESRPELKFISEEYKPFNYLENSLPAGLAPELLNEICSQLNLDCEINFMSWEEGYRETLQTDNAVLFSTALNAKRKDQFKWAGPIASLDWNFYAAVPNTISISNLEEAKSVSTIGVIADYAIEEYLVEQGFTNLQYCADINEAIEKLLSGEINLFPSNTYAINSALEKAGESVYAVASEFTIQTELLYFAFNKGVSDNMVYNFQDAINRCKLNGVLKNLSQKYLNKSEFPDFVQVYTEGYPPLTFMDKNGEVTGYGTDIVKEIMKRNGVNFPIKLTSWSNGYQLALNNPWVCLFTMDRTPIRENSFQWVGPIGTNTTWIYTKAGSSLTIESLEDAKELEALGTVSSWFSTQHLQEQGFTNLVYESDPKVLTEKLMNGQIDAFVCTDITFPDILKDLGYTYEDVRPTFSVMASDFYVTFSNGTPPVIAQQAQSTFEAMKADGTYQAIQQKWFSEINND